MGVGVLVAVSVDVNEPKGDAVVEEEEVGDGVAFADLEKLGLHVVLLTVSVAEEDKVTQRDAENRKEGDAVALALEELEHVAERDSAETEDEGDALAKNVGAEKVAETLEDNKAVADAETEKTEEGASLGEPWVEVSRGEALKVSEGAPENVTNLVAAATLFEPSAEVEGIADELREGALEAEMVGVEVKQENADPKLDKLAERLSVAHEEDEVVEQREGRSETEPLPLGNALFKAQREADGELVSRGDRLVDEVALPAALGATDRVAHGDEAPLIVPTLAAKVGVALPVPHKVVDGVAHEDAEPLLETLTHALSEPVPEPVIIAVAV